MVTVSVLLVLTTGKVLALLRDHDAASEARSWTPLTQIIRSPVLSSTWPSLQKPLLIDFDPAQLHLVCCDAVPIARCDVRKYGSFVGFRPRSPLELYRSPSCDRCVGLSRLRAVMAYDVLLIEVFWRNTSLAIAPSTPGWDFRDRIHVLKVWSVSHIVGPVSYQASEMRMCRDSRSGSERENCEVGMHLGGRV